MTNYKITFEKNGVYQANMATAENIEDVRRYCDEKGKNVIAIKEANDSEMNEANRKGMPIITIEHIEENQEDEEMEETRTTEEIKEAMKNYFENNENEFIEVIEELDSYNGYLGDDRYYNMEELDEMLYGLTPSEVLARTFYGGDDDTKDANGNRGEFNPNREYFYYNGYGNLCSTDYKDNYNYYLDENFINEVIENAGNLYNVPDEIQKLLDELEKIEA